MDKKKKLIIIGASGHGKVILDMALRCGYEMVGFLDDNSSTHENGGYPVLGPIKMAAQYAREYGDSLGFVLGIGSNAIRRKLEEEYTLPWATLIHPGAVIGRQVTIGEGTVVMANAVINPSAVIGKHCIINTSAVIEHDNRIGDYVHISPGAVLAGTVTVGNGTHIGAGAVIRNNVIVTENVIVGAGAAVIKDIMEPGTYAGVPVHRIK